MGNEDSTSITSDDSRKNGAIACLQAIRIIDRITDGINHETKTDDYWHGLDAAKVAMLHAFGATDGFAAGFISAMAEYVHFSLSTGEPNLYVWKPEDSMTEEEKEKKRFNKSD